MVELPRVYFIWLLIFLFGLYLYSGLLASLTHLVIFGSNPSSDVGQLDLFSSPETVLSDDDSTLEITTIAEMTHREVESEETAYRPMQYVINEDTEILNGTCSKSAYLVGNKQRVISYTLYGTNPGYWMGLNKTLDDVKRLFPGWFVRIYTDQPNSSRLKDLLPSHSQLHICDVHNLPRPVTSLRNYPSMLWRYFPLGDPQIEVLTFRDTDSKVLERERDAVMDWLDNSTKSLHVMRDHPFHLVPILGGMWGARMTPKNSDRWRKARNTIFKRSFQSNLKKNLDQWLLAMTVWPQFRGDVFAHDSFLCHMFEPSRPFPTKRENFTFVGSAEYRGSKNAVTSKCPKKCRPKKHKDWSYC